MSGQKLRVILQNNLKIKDINFQICINSEPLKRAQFFVQVFCTSSNGRTYGTKNVLTIGIDLAGLVKSLLRRMTPGTYSAHKPTKHYHPPTLRPLACTAHYLPSCPPQHSWIPSNPWPLLMPYNCSLFRGSLLLCLLVLVNELIKHKTKYSGDLKTNFPKSGFTWFRKEHCLTLMEGKSHSSKTWSYFFLIRPIFEKRIFILHKIVFVRNYV